MDWVYMESPDILCLQETKGRPEQFGDELLRPQGYKTYWSSAQRKGYSGTGVLTRREPVSVWEGLGVEAFDAEGRTLILDYGEFVLLNIYFPNGGSGNRRVSFKMAFCEAFLKKVNRFKDQGRAVIVCGDVNTAHEEIDLARPKENEGNTGFLPEERAWVCRWLESGYVDTFRHFCKDGGHYSWWDYKTRARQRNVGWRIDYFVTTKNLLPKIQKAFILEEVMGSDHCPVGIELG